VVDLYRRKGKMLDKRQVVCGQATNKYIPMGGDDMLAKTIRCHSKMEARMEELAQEVARMEYSDYSTHIDVPM
jgi:hypothetical protein